MGNCGDRSAVVTINHIPKKYPIAVYIPISISLNSKYNTTNNHFFSNINVTDCFKYSVGPFFLQKHLKQIFPQKYQKETESSTNSLTLYTQYDSFIKTKTLKEKNILEITNFLNSNNLTNIFSLSQKEISEHLMYCSNNLFRLALYHKVLSEIELSLSFTEDHDKEKYKLWQSPGEHYLKKAKNQIELDTFRTYPKSDISTYQNYVSNFNSILYEIACRNESITYTQGMNFICGFILMISGNERNEAFFLMSKLMSLKSKKFNICFEKCYVIGFELLENFIELFNDLLKTFLPKIYDKIKEIDIIPHCWFVKWVQIMFLTSFDNEMVVKFWDLIICFGIDFIVVIALCVCDLLKDKILKCNSLMDFNYVIDNGKVHLTNVEKGNLYELIYNEIRENKYKLIDRI